MVDLSTPIIPLMYDDTLQELIDEDEDTFKALKNAENDLEEAVQWHTKCLFRWVEADKKLHEYKVKKGIKDERISN